MRFRLGIQQQNLHGRPVRQQGTAIQVIQRKFDCKDPLAELRRRPAEHRWFLGAALPSDVGGDHLDASRMRPGPDPEPSCQDLRIRYDDQGRRFYAAGFRVSRNTEVTFLARTMQEASRLFTELEQAIDDFLIPALNDRPPVSNEERQIVSLPCRNGGLGLINPT